MKGDLISEALLRAAAHIEQFGWQRYMFGAANEPCCLVGAIRVVLKIPLEEHADERVIKAIERVQKSSKIQSLADWNDAQERTKEEVLNALRKAAE